MGAGKSTVGKILSDSTGYKFMDLDDLIEKRSNKKITEIFSQMGEEHFRKLETDCLTGVSKENGNIVVSTGGGIVVKKANLDIIESSGTGIYLKAGMDTIWERISEERGRPLLDVNNPYETARDLLESRKELYERAEYIVETDGLTPHMISEKIVEILFN